MANLFLIFGYVISIRETQSLEHGGWHEEHYYSDPVIVNYF